ncbi:hypothetical protein DTO013E5_2132 [Penicillium roqueforti]|nr:hypothetical protein DTO012A1_7181 [Penicillium roqueforti]KAI2748596.1 hypothetical protein DTO013F2_6332 [Penicillium roqueforti]KAI2753762.1 hypothetical protein DTO006G1_8895 [Penicillium roqueforti]KAI3154381.1 hypothetical protein CBS147325_1473 [Penicillium roqueforti]KAI3156140.1 hypothetical protein DTO046C5_7930 [Penicillium roqueforti]
MSRRAQIEEVSDSDPEEIAPSYDSDEDLPRNAIIAPVNIPRAAPQPQQQQMPMPMPMPSMPAPEPQREIPRHFSCLYPVYFDKTRSRAEGRKVGAELAVENPLARDIVDAVQMLGLNAGLEPEKLHPKDWANPGRVRAQVRTQDGQLANPKIKNKHHLYILVAQYLKANPTTEKSPYRLRIRGLPMPEKLPAAPAAPRGWKIGTILPIHSPAYSGGGVSDNPLKDAMAEMQGMEGMPNMSEMMSQMGGMGGLSSMLGGLGGLGGMGGMGGEPSGAGAEKKKKEKRKVIRA